MGKQPPPQNKLFVTGFSLEKRIRTDHPLRRIAEVVDFDFIYDEVAGKYGSKGNVSVPPPVILKLMLLLVFYNVRSERELMDTLPERLDWLWFLGYDLEDDVPNHSVLSKARKRWGMVSRILRRDGLRPKAAGMFYKAVVQAVLLYGAETWAVSPAMLKALEGFHHRVACQLTGKVGRYLPWEDRWYYPPIEEALEEAGLFPIKVYIDRRQNTLVDHVATRPLLGLCLDCDKLDGSSRAQLWWEQSNVAALVTTD